MSVKKPNILSDNEEDNYVWEVLNGLVSYLPSFIEGDNILNLGYSIDRVMQLYNIYTLNRLEAHHVNDDDYDTINGDELNNYLDQMGIPYIRNDTSVNKKRRLRDWWKYNYGGGTEKSIKYTIYNFIGSGVFIPYDGGNTNPELTNRIRVANPSSGGQWGDYDISLSYIDWADYSASSGSAGSWGDYLISNKSNMDLQIFFGDLNNYYKWMEDGKRADVYYLFEKVSPVGLVYTISHIYDGSLSNNKLWYRLNVGGNEIHSVNNYLSYNTTTATSGINGAIITYSGASDGYLSGTILSDVIISGTEFSMSLWLKVISDYANYDRVMEINNSSIQFKLYAQPDFSTGLVVQVGDGLAKLVYNGDVSSGAHNIVITASSGSEYSIYVDNDAGSSSTGATFTNITINSGTDLIIGRSASNTNPSNIQVDEIMIFDRVITASERQELYEGGKGFYYT